jgi:hypothetical protein
MKDSVGINLGEWMLIPAIRWIVVSVTSVGCMADIVQRVLHFLGWPTTNQQN